MLVTAAIDDDVLARLRDSDLGVGLHVNLTLGRPLTPGRSLTDGAGAFRRDARRQAATADAREVEREIDAQIDRFLDLLRRPPTHLDTHHHVGLYEPVHGIVLAAARRLGVAVRSQNAAARTRARSAGLATPDHFFGESGPEPYWSSARTLRHLRELPAGVSEFMTHPGWFDESLAWSRYGRQREVEMVGVGTPPARAAAQALGIALATFAGL